jgi:carbonic anhydrase/acetyltransferase-like protein (isoleucine patch superfamily)
MIYQLGHRRLETRTERYWIAPDATLIGSVVLGDNASVWFHTVIRADNDTISIGDDTNIQDGAVLHVDPGTPLNLGTGVTVGHNVMLHGCDIDDHSLVGINTVVLNGATIGKHCIIGANTLVPEGMEVPDNSLVLGSPGKVVKEIEEHHRSMLEQSARHYVEHAHHYQQDLIPDPRFSESDA